MLLEAGVNSNLGRTDAVAGPADPITSHGQPPGRQRSSVITSAIMINGGEFDSRSADK